MVSLVCASLFFRLPISRRWNTEACDVSELREEPVLESFEATPDIPPVPCITTSDGCTVEAAAGIAFSAAEGPAADHGKEAVTQDPCWWDEGCYATA